MEKSWVRVDVPARFIGAAVPSRISVNCHKWSMMNTAEQIHRRIAGSIAEQKFGTPMKFGVKFASEINATCDWFRMNHPVAEPRTVGCLFAANNTRSNGTLLVAENTVYTTPRTVVMWRKSAPQPLGWDNLTFDEDGEVSSRTPALGVLSRRDELGMAERLQDEVVNQLRGAERRLVGNDYIGNGSLCAAAVRADRSKARAKLMEATCRAIVESADEEFDSKAPRAMMALARQSLPCSRNARERRLLVSLRKILK
jgi:hypothetical protein